MNISQQVVILSAENPTNTNEGNRARTTTLEHCLEDIRLPFKKTTGVFNGVEEESFVVVVRDQLEIDTLKDFAFKNFDQEAVLYQDANQEAYLLNADGSTQQLGRLTAVSEEIAVKSGNYTVMNDLFYIAVPRT